MPEEMHVPVESSQASEEFGQPLVQSPDLLLFLLNRTEIANLLSHQLKGEFYNEKNEKWEQKGMPLMNDEGIKWFCTLISSYLSVDKIATRFEEEEVKRMAMSIRLDIVNKLTLCWKGFKINMSDLDTIVDIIDHYVYASLSASRNATILNFMKPTFKRVETYGPGKQKSKWSSLIPFGGD